MTDHTGSTYTIRTVSDFLAVPEDRRDVCLKEFHVWCSLIAATKAAFCGIKMPDAFMWVDDGKHTADLSIEHGGKELWHVHGTMKGFGE